MSADTLAGHVGGLHDLAEALEQTGIPTGAVTVSIHASNGAHAARLADALGLTDRLDFKEADGHHRNFTRWAGVFDGVDIYVIGETPKRPDTCCGKCPPIKGGGYDCTCEGNPRCTDQEDQA